MQDVLMTAPPSESNQDKVTARSIPWLRVLVEGVVIVLSVLLALGADAWWQGQLEREEEDGLLRSLHAEITLNLDRLTEWDSIEGRMAFSATQDKSRNATLFPNLKPAHSHEYYTDITPE
jgi:hypothetical protein